MPPMISRVVSFCATSRVIVCALVLCRRAVILTGLPRDSTAVSPGSLAFSSQGGNLCSNAALAVLLVMVDRPGAAQAAAPRTCSNGRVAIVRRSAAQCPSMGLLDLDRRECHQGRNHSGPRRDETRGHRWGADPGCGPGDHAARDPVKSSSMPSGSEISSSIRCAEAEARLGMEINMNDGPGYYGSGGPWVPRDKA